MFPGAKAEAEQLVHPHIEAAQCQTADQPELRPHGLDVPHPLQVLIDPGVAIGCLVFAEFIAGAAAFQCREGRLRRHHPGFHGVVRTFDARHVDEARRAADQHAAGKEQLRHRLETPFGDGAGAIGDAAATAQDRLDQRVMLEALEFRIGIEIGILIVEMHHQADRNQIVFQVIHEAAAAGLQPQRPAHGMGHLSLAVVFGEDLPQLFHAKPELLRFAILRQLEPGNDFLGERAAHAFGDKNIFAEQFHAGLEIILGLTILADAHDAGDDALDGAVVTVEHFGTGKARIDFDPQSLRLLPQPAADIAQRNSVVAVIAHQRRHQRIGKPHGPLRTQHEETVFVHGRVEGRAPIFPVGNEFVEGNGIDDGARENMGAHFRTFFQHADRDIGRKLLQPDRRGKSRGTGADDDDIILHRVALDLFHSHNLRRCVRAPRLL